jgi:aspartate-semialdehyde dehydrogenase
LRRSPASIGESRGALTVRATFDVAVVGATGLVGETMLSVLEQRRFPVGRVHALASERSAGRQLRFGGRELTVENLAEFDFSRVQIALFSAGAAVSGEHAPRAAAAGCVVIDNTSRFRMEPDVPLVVPEVNAAEIASARARGIIANPNCSTIQLVVVLKPIYDRVGIERVNVATYQSVSGAGRRALESLKAQTTALLEGASMEAGDGPRPLAANVVPHIDVFEDNGYTREEMKIVRETRKIMGDPTLRVNATAARVPVWFGHSEAVHIETRERLTARDARALLSDAPGVVVVDDMPQPYPTALTHADGTDPVYVGRIREDVSHERGLDLWIVSDNVRKGAALNSVQIAEIWAEQ